jgi:hypothetical protein
MRWRLPSTRVTARVSRVGAVSGVEPDYLVRNRQQQEAVASAYYGKAIHAHPLFCRAQPIGSTWPRGEGVRCGKVPLGVWHRPARLG